MKKKLAVIVDNKEVTTETENTELCSSACDVAMETCSSRSHDTYRMLCKIRENDVNNGIKQRPLVFRIFVRRTGDFFVKNH